jgi:hypothetical protein
VTFDGEFLRKQEEQDWWALQKFKADGAARVHFTFKCQDEAAAKELHERLRGLSCDDVTMHLVPDSATAPAIDHERLKEMQEVLSKITGRPPNPTASIAVLTSDPGWRVAMKTHRIDDREQLAHTYRDIRALLEDARWTWEGGGVGP